MRPHPNDQDHNLSVGVALRELILSLWDDGYRGDHLNREVGATINSLSQKAYDLGLKDAVVPSRN
jgi:hypothetical protein